jgi:hypothetical protein
MIACKAVLTDVQEGRAASIYMVQQSNLDCKTLNTNPTAGNCLPVNIPRRLEISMELV